MGGKSGHHNQQPLHPYLTDIVCFCQSKTEGFVEVSEDTSTSNLEISGHPQTTKSVNFPDFWRKGICERKIYNLSVL